MARVGTISSQAIQVEGLVELNAALRHVDIALPKEMRTQYLDVAKHVVVEAQRKMEFGPGAAAESLKPQATQTGAGITMPAGGAPWRGVPVDYYPWLEFGGTVGRGRVAHSGHLNAKGVIVSSHLRADVAGGVKRDFIKGGRYLYPAISDSSAYIAEASGKAVDKVCHEADLTVRNT